jgi:hypothetical protein
LAGCGWAIADFSLVALRVIHSAATLKARHANPTTYRRRERFSLAFLKTAAEAPSPRTQATKPEAIGKAAR